MSIATRLPITVPAAGAFLEVAVAGRVVYVELSPVNTPDGVPTWHLEKAGDGLPLYSRSALAYLPSFRRFWIRGTSDAAGETLNLLVYDDPCAEGIYTDAPPIFFNPCPEPSDPELPAGDPDQMLVATSGEIRIVDFDGNVVSSLVAGTQIGSPWVDYVAGVVWYGQSNGLGNRSLWKVNFDGTGNAEVQDTGAASFGGTAHGVAWDNGLGRFVLTQHNVHYSITPDGATMTTYASFGGSRRHTAPRGDGVHIYLTDGGAIRLRTHGGTHIDAIVGTFPLAVVDPLGSGVYTGNDAVGLQRMDYDLGASEELDELGNVFIGSIYGRWLYYSARSSTQQDFKRLHMDDPTRIETLAEGQVPTTCEGIWPWWS